MTVPADRDSELDAARRSLIAVFRAYIDREAPGLIDRFIDHLLKVKDRGMRAQALVFRLRRLDRHMCFAILSGVLDRSIRRNLAAQEVLLDLTTTRPLITALGYVDARRIYELAHRRDRPEVARMLLSPESLEGRTKGATDPHSENKHMTDMALGRRKAMARVRNRLELDRLMHDRHPGVIANLLNNPIITERDVVRVAAMRPTNAEVLTLVFRHRRWISRYRVKVAIALNPFTPIDIALSVLPHLMLPDLRRAATTRTLKEEVRKSAQTLIEGRGKAVLTVEEVPTHFVAPGGTSVQAMDGGILDIDLEAIEQGLDSWMADPADRRD
jgi:hypothetical protein